MIITLEIAVCKHLEAVLQYIELKGGFGVSGHSKWANIKHRKAKQDAQRGKIFTKLGRELILAARAGGGDPATNLRLKMAVNKAREANMPMENITRAIKRGTGEIEGAAYEEVVYEGYGPGGVAVMLSAATDNRNRTAAEIRHIFSKNGGSLGESGCVAWMFSRKGVLNLEEIITAPEDFEKVRDSLARSGLTFTRAEVTMVPQNVVSVSDRQQADAVLRLVDLLEDHDDVQEVYANFDIPDAIMDSL